MTKDTTKKHHLGIECIRDRIQSAEEGCAEDQNLLGIYYKNGLYDLPQDYTEAAKWFIKAAEQDDNEAQFALALFYADGLGVDKDWAQAKYWFTKAAVNIQEGDDITLSAKIAIKLLSESDSSKVLSFQDALHELSKTKSKVYDMDEIKKLLSWDCEKWFAVPQDYVEAVKQYKTAAEQGDPYALVHLGLCYADGLGVDKDWEQAKRYFTEAILADNWGDDLLTIDAKAALKVLCDCEGEKISSFADRLREFLEMIRRVYQGGGSSGRKS